MDCANCKFFQPSKHDMGGGWCRRFPPIGNSEFPFVDKKEWCGEYQTAEPS